MPATIVRIRRSIRSCTSGLNVRTVPRSTTSCGITFQVSPPCTCVTLTTPASSGCRLRETIVCSALIACAANSIGSLPGVGHRRVRALAGRDDLEDVEGAHQRPGAHRDRADRLQRPVVHAVDRAHRKAVEQPFLDHHAAAAFVLLGRLEDEVDGAVEALASARAPRPRPAASSCGRRGRRRASCPAICRRVRARRTSRGCAARRGRRAGRSRRCRIAPCAARRRRRSSRARCARRARTSAACRRRTRWSPSPRTRSRDGRGGGGARPCMLGDERGDFGNEVHGNLAHARMDEARC